MILTSQIGKKIFRQFTLLVASLLFAISLYSQTDSTFLDTKGNDFWLTFPPNYHNGKMNPSSYYDDSLYIFITADKPTSGVIEYLDLKGNLNTRNFSISDSIKFYKFSVFYIDYELIGYNDNDSSFISGSFVNRNHSEVITKQYFHITTVEEVTVFAHNQANTTSDACLVLPTDVLGKNYFVLTYNSDGDYLSGYGLFDDTTPSQFVILSIEDSTLVTIIPKAWTNYHHQDKQKIIMNRGDAYLVQAFIGQDRLRTDLTGTEIYSDKPVAVFAGHQRARIPNDNSYGTPSRDYLFEQMPPVETWGKNYFLIPYMPSETITQYGTDIFRLLASNDNTDVFINDSLVKKLNRGKFYEDSLLNPLKVVSSEPILVAQFKKTSTTSQLTPLGLSDPFEMLIPPVEQFMTNFKIVNPQAYQISDSSYIYTEHYIIIVVEDLSKALVLLDGNYIQDSIFEQIPSSNYYYANISVSEGLHTISCTSKIGVYVYGYGEANSYGFCGGMALQPIGLVGIKENEDEKLSKDILYQNYPNPVSNISYLKYSITESGHVLLVVYDLLGNQRMILVNEKLAPGIYEVKINTEELEQGIYFYSLVTGNNVISKPLIIRK